MARTEVGVLSRRLGGPAGSVRWSAAVARRVIARLQSGESLRSICRDPEMPHRATLALWREKIPEFAEAVRLARAATGWGGSRALWCEATAMKIFARMCEGETLTSICRDPDMPSFTTVWNWRRDRPAFRQALETAQRIQAERLCDEGWEIAKAVTPQTAYATQVQLGHLRWMIAARAPARFGRFRPVAPEAEAEAAGPENLKISFAVRRFEKVTGPDGRQYVRELERLPRDAGG
jgi:transposase-like protein